MGHTRTARSESHDGVDHGIGVQVVDEFRMDRTRNKTRKNGDPYFVVGPPVHLHKERTHEIDTRLFKRRQLLHAAFRKWRHSLVLRAFKLLLTYSALCNDAFRRLKSTIYPVALSNRIECVFGTRVHLLNVHVKDERA